MKKTGGSAATSSILTLMSGDLASCCPPEEISLYIHVPFCRHQCPYCHFYVVKNNPLIHESFVDQLIVELGFYQDSLQTSQLRSIYLGGGTPSLLSLSLLEKLLQSIEKTVALPSDVEITLEANPENLTLEQVKQWRQLGINRLSLGIQSLVDEELLALGRGHRTSTALQAIETVAQAGFRSYSLDLMIETPRQSLSSWKKTLNLICQNPPPHLSLYNLVIEPGTPFAKRESQIRRSIVDPEVGKEMLIMACEMLSKAGLERYEISAFARPGHESIHNTGYWRGRSFIGLGPSAFSFLPPQRLQNIPNIQAWSTSVQDGKRPIGLIDDLSPLARQAELLAVHLRLSQGVNLPSFTKRWGPLSNELARSLDQLISTGYIEQSGPRLMLSDKGKLFYERVAEELVIIE